eukprot:scaffold23278_cov59-Phaeocystis_antarctica.AAC.2
MSTMPPVMPTPEEQAAKEAAQVIKRIAQLERLAKLPEHLRLGVTLPGMRKLLAELPDNALEQVNANLEQANAKQVKKGKEPYPKNLTLNGYGNQYFITMWAKEAKEGQPEGDRLAVCERLKKQRSPHVGEATVFVSWFLNTPIATLLDALANFLEEKELREEDTFFWVCDYVIRQTDVDPDLALLGECVSAVGHTVLLMEPWDAPAPLKRAYCIKEVYYTQASGAHFDVGMSSAQQAAFEKALVDDFDSIKMSLSKVDVRTATCRNAEDTKAILGELEQGVGFVACNSQVIGLLREALVAQARAALGRLPAAERGTSGLTNNLGGLLKEMGKLKEARLLFEEALQACRETLGDHGQAGGGEAAARGGAAGAEGDAGRPPPEQAALDQQHGRAADGHGPAGGGEAVARGGPAGAEGDAGRPPPEHADLDRQPGQPAGGHGPAGGGEAVARGGPAGAEGDAGRPPPEHADLDRQHGPAAEGHGPAGGGEAAVRRGAAGEEGDAGRPPPEHADLDQQHGRAAAGHGPAGGGEAVVRGGAAGKEGDAGRPPPGHADLDQQHGPLAVYAR